MARSTFPSQKVQNTSGPDHFWKLRCRKSARRCGAKHISKWKCTKHTMVGPLLEVAMSKKCTPLWREAHFQMKMYKTHRGRTTFGSWDVEKVHAALAKHISKSKCTKHHMFAPLLDVQISKKCTPLWREAHFEVKMLKTLGVRTTFGGSDVASLRFTRLHYITLHYTTLHYTATTLHYTTLHSTTLQLQLHNYTPVHYTKLHYTTPHYLPLDFTTIHSTTLHYTTTTQLHSTTLNYTTLHDFTLHSTTLHYITLRYLPLHFTTLHYTTLHYTTTTTTQLHSATLHYTKLHYTTLN